MVSPPSRQWQPLPVQFVAPGETLPLVPEVVPPVLAGMESYDSLIPMEQTARTFGSSRPAWRLPSAGCWAFRGSREAQMGMAARNGPEIPAQSSQLFMLRMWLEELGEGQTGLRGKVQHVTSGEVRYFHDWTTLETFLEGILYDALQGGQAESSAEL